MLFTLCRSLFPCCSDKWSGAEVESVADVAVCCPARGRLLLSVLWLTGTHLFKGAERTYYAPPVASLRCAAAIVWPAGPGWSIFSPTSPPRRLLSTYLREQAIRSGQNGRKQD